MKLLALQFTMLFSRKLLNEEEVYCVFPQIELSLVLLHRRDPLPSEATVHEEQLWVKRVILSYTAQISKIEAKQVHYMHT